jgi:hypothetical protein
MIRERILTISTLLALGVLSGVAHAEPALTRKGSEGGPSSQTRQTEPNWYRARAMQEGGAARPNRAGGDEPPNWMPLPVFRWTERPPYHMLTLTRCGMGVDPNGVERSSERPRYVSKHSIVPNGSTASARSND